MKLIFTIFIIVILNIFKIFSQDIISEKNYDVSFEYPNALSKHVVFPSYSYNQCIKTNDNGLLFVFRNYFNTVIDDTIYELTFPSIAKIDNDLNLQWLTELRGSNNIVNHSLNSIDENIELYGSICTNGEFQSGWGGCHPIVFELDKFGNKKSEKFNIDGYSFSYYITNFRIIGDYIITLYGDGVRMFYDIINKDTYELIKRDTIIEYPRNNENKLEIAYIANEWQFIDEDNIIIIGNALDNEPGPLKFKSFAMIYNKSDKTYKFIKNELFDNGIQSSVFMIINDTKIILYSSSYIIILDRETLSEISSIAIEDLGIPNSLHSSLGSIDITEQNELILSITNYNAKDAYYSVIKTDINFNVIWRKDFINDCNLIPIPRVRSLPKGIIVFATLCNDSLKLKIFKDNTVGVSEGINYSGKFLISPNPTSDFINISTENNEGLPSREVQILNLLGLVVSKSELIDGNNRIDISDLPRGTYFIKVGDKVEKFVKM